MKHIAQFDDFLADTVNLNQTRIDLLEGRIKTISDLLRNSAYKPRIRRFMPQGSWAHKTIIKPPDDRDFDADLLIILDEVEDWSAAQYIDDLYEVFHSNKNYESMVSSRTRCVVLDYASDFHLDIVPVIQDIGENGKRFFVCNRSNNCFEEAAPEAYTDWFAEQNQIIGANQLRKVTRLFKYLRDVKKTFSAKSILLTTLVGKQISDADEYIRDSGFSDIPTSLKTIIDRLDSFLQNHPKMPVIKNPVLPNEDFNRHWDQRKYENFQDKIHLYRDWINNAYTESDKNESIIKWRKIFGDEFAKNITLFQSVSIVSPYEFTNREFADWWLTRIREHGREVLQFFPTNQKHLETPKWSMENQLIVTVKAKRSALKNGNINRTLASGDIIPKNRQIKFTALSEKDIPSSLKIWWRVANSGGYAAQEGQLRGKFESSTEHHVRMESTKYRGVHWVEAFVVNPKTDQCVGKSKPFFVVIE